MNKVKIFIDTNILEDINKKLYEFKFNEIYEKLKKFIKYNRYDNFHIMVPQIAILEIKKHYIEEFERIDSSLKEIDNKYNKIESDLQTIGYEFEIEKNRYKDIKEFEAYFEDIFNQYIEQEKDNFEIIPLPNESRFHKIIERAIKKEHPFFGGNMKAKKVSDAGFKDVVFLESIVEKMEEEENNVEYIIITKDNIVNGLNWTKEIEGKNGKSINYSSSGEIINFICEEYELEDLADYIEFSETEYFKEKILTALNKSELVQNSQKVSIVENEDGDKFIEVECTIKNGEENVNVIVILDSTKEFINISDINHEIIYQW